jgi:hypothetical protein
MMVYQSDSLSLECLPARPGFVVRPSMDQLFDSEIEEFDVVSPSISVSLSINRSPAFSFIMLEAGHPEEVFKSVTANPFDDIPISDCFSSCLALTHI